jgi:hypothetical protein
MLKRRISSLRRNQQTTGAVLDGSRSFSKGAPTRREGAFRLAVSRGRRASTGSTNEQETT